MLHALESLKEKKLQTETHLNKIKDKKLLTVNLWMKKLHKLRNKKYQNLYGIHKII